MFDSDLKKPSKRFIQRNSYFPNETMKQLAVRIENSVQKFYSLNAHNFKITKTKEILRMTLTPQLKKLHIKRASQPSSLGEPDVDFRKLENEIERAETTIKLDENLKLQYVKTVQITTSHMNNIQESDNEKAEKFTQTLNIYEKNPNF